MYNTLLCILVCIDIFWLQLIFCLSVCHNSVVLMAMTFLNLNLVIKEHLNTFLF